MKQCTKCLETKPVEEFAFRSKVKGTRKSHCKVCVSASDRAAYTGDRAEKIRARAKAHKANLIQRLWDYKQGMKCFDCGNKDPRVFEFDHLPEFEKSKDISAMVRDGHSWESIRAEIAKCDIVCANCHRIRTYERGGWRRNAEVQLDNAGMV